MDEAMSKLMAMANDTAPEAWELLVRAQVVDGWLDLLAFALFAVFTYGCGRWGYVIHRDLEAKPPVSIGDDRHIGRFALVLCACFFSILCVAHLGDGIARIITPEVFAVRELIGK